MGIRGLLTFVNENRLTVKHQLHDTTLLIDGLNLENELYRSYLREHNYKAYGGDYTHLTVYIRAFFQALIECNITPIVIMDGSFESDKTDIIKERFDQRLKTAYALSQGRDPSDEEINSLFNPYVFVEVVRSMNILLYQGIYEADDIIPQIGYDLACPILSGDSDFFVFNFPGGIVPLKALVVDFRVKVSASGFKYIECELYKLDSLQRKFPGLQAELVELSGAILGNDYLDYNEAINIIHKLPRPIFSHSKYRQWQIYTVFSWLSSQRSYEYVLSNLKQICDNPNHKLIKCIQDRYVGFHKSAPAGSKLSIEEYFKRNRDNLFKREPEVPKWAHDLFVDSRMQKRLISIIRSKVEFFRPLVEDFSIEKCSYECCFQMLPYIYGLLRSSDRNVTQIDRYVRQGHARLNQRITPLLVIGSEKLPMFEHIESMNEQKRVDLFFKILGFDQILLGNVKKIFSDSKVEVEDSKANELTTLLLSAIYLSRNFSGELWIEFFYALLVNIILIGHLTKVKSEHIPVLLPLDPTDRKALAQLIQFDSLPKVSYQARIVHFYNAFQNCLENITFLAQILNLSVKFPSDQLVAGLQGTFIYNLTNDLAARDSPLHHLEENMLADFKQVEFFQKILDLELNNGERKYLASGKQDQVDRAVVPDFVLTNKFANGRLFVRALRRDGNFTNLDILRAQLP